MVNVRKLRKVCCHSVTVCKFIMGPFRLVLFTFEIMIFPIDFVCELVLFSLQSSLFVTRGKIEKAPKICDVKCGSMTQSKAEGFKLLEKGSLISVIKMCRFRGSVRIALEVRSETEAIMLMFQIFKLYMFR